MTPLMWQDNKLILLDQRKLPAVEDRIICSRMKEVIYAISVLAVRGAPAIGVAAAYGMVLAWKEWYTEQGRLPKPDEYQKYTSALASARPTAVNLQFAVSRMQSKYTEIYVKELGYDGLYEALLAEAKAIHQEDIQLNAAIAKHGANLFDHPVRVLTHCNAGALATTGVGTALGVVRELWRRKQLLHVYMDETRPLLQGSRLTAYEMVKEGIPATLICDNMAAAVMRHFHVDAIIVGADRIVNNGDTANKIGTYGLAVLAKYHEIPFYIAAPSTTFDFSLSSGDEIHIEEREGDEVRFIGNYQSAPRDVQVYNPAFDVTPGQLITGIITEKGVLKPPFPQSISKFQRSVK